ncbi:MAG: hypothetical protein RLZZ488_1780 [Pseudomonadota bacterium]|jgi:hypothetical protein
MLFWSRFAVVSSVILAVTTVGCVTKRDVSDKLNVWVGTETDELVKYWGPPHNSYMSKNLSKVFQYSATSSGSIPFTTTSSRYTVSGFQTESDTSYLPYQLKCTVRFFISKENRVVRASWKGSTELCESEARAATQPD